MYRYKVEATRNGYNKNKVKTFIMEANNNDELLHRFMFKYPNCTITSFICIDEFKPKNSLPSPLKQRNHFKARLCQMRNNIQSMTDSDSPYLTHEETIQLQRISCKLDNVISKFGMRTMDLKHEGVLP